MSRVCKEKMYHPKIPVETSIFTTIGREETAL
ncbi:hypothetical protein MXB_3894 [Myxobolus squamalis]|nr:hypothetical protein MXB_3894 [Myxobolus squamalis]